MSTKFVGAGRQWATDPHRDSALDAARSSARSVRSLLRSRGITDVPVDAVLIPLGPGSPVIERGWVMTQEVVVLSGGSPAAWREAWNQGSITALEGKAIAASWSDTGARATPMNCKRV